MCAEPFIGGKSLAFLTVRWRQVSSAFLVSHRGWKPMCAEPFPCAKLSSVLSLSHFRFGYFVPTERVHLISDMVDFYGV
jgi:hypothetical protein